MPKLSILKRFKLSFSKQTYFVAHRSSFLHSLIVLPKTPLSSIFLQTIQERASKLITPIRIPVYSEENSKGDGSESQLTLNLRQDIFQKQYSSVTKLRQYRGLLRFIVCDQIGKVYIKEVQSADQIDKATDAQVQDSQAQKENKTDNEILSPQIQSKLTKRDSQNFSASLKQPTLRIIAAIDHNSLDPNVEILFVQSGSLRLLIFFSKILLLLHLVLITGMLTVVNMIYQDNDQNEEVQLKKLSKQSNKVDQSSNQFASKG